MVRVALGRDPHGFLDSRKREDLSAAGPAAVIDLVQHGPLVQPAFIRADDVIDDSADFRDEFPARHRVQRPFRRGDRNTKWRLGDIFTADIDRPFRLFDELGPGERLRPGMVDGGALRL